MYSMTTASSGDLQNLQRIDIEVTSRHQGLSLTQQSDGLGDFHTSPLHSDWKCHFNGKDRGELSSRATSTCTKQIADRVRKR